MNINLPEYISILLLRMSVEVGILFSVEWKRDFSECDCFKTAMVWNNLHQSIKVCNFVSYDENISGKKFRIYFNIL